MCLFYNDLSHKVWPKFKKNYVLDSVINPSVYNSYAYTTGETTLKEYREFGIEKHQKKDE